MMTRLHKLKEKAAKGFTLVELIIVIAIIGVLVAIIVPVMVNYSRVSRVASLNSTALSLKKDISAWFTEMYGKGYAVMTLPDDREFSIDVVSKGTFAVNAAGLVQCFNGAPYPGYDQDLNDWLGDRYAKMIPCHIDVVFYDGTVVGVLLSGDATLRSTNAVSWNSGYWNSPGATKEGLAPNGVIFGSYPAHSVSLDS